MNLALALGIVDPRTIFDWDWELVMIWLTYFERHPYGEMANDFRNAYAIQSNLSLWAGKESKKDVKIENYLLGDFDISKES